MSTAAPKRGLPWFQLGLLGLLMLSLALRFWGLGRFNTLVFDEVYYAKFAHKYLTQTPFFDGHPPLSKYIIAGGMWLGDRLPFGQMQKNGLTGGLYAPWTYRWVNALTGSFIPLAIATLAYQLTRWRTYGLVAGLFAALDGLFLVESRYALNNVYLVLFALVGWLCLLQGLPQREGRSRPVWLTLAGIGFGASASIKWNGLWFLLGVYGLWGCAQGIHWCQQTWFQHRNSAASADLGGSLSQFGRSPLQEFWQVRWWQMAVYLGVVPFATYFVEWIPHLLLNAKYGIWGDFWAMQQEILAYHERVGNGTAIHPYCSPWFSWLVMWRPVAYFYQVAGRGDPLPTERSLPVTAADPVVYDVHALGNPFLWWFSTIAIALVLALVLGLAVLYFLEAGQGQTPQRRAISRSLRQLGLMPNEQWLLLFLAVNYLANVLPWVRVSRCIFLYHYMGALVFASLALAWLVDRWLHSRLALAREVGIAVLLIGAIAFVFWWPIYVGWPLSLKNYCWWGTEYCVNEFTLRMWLRSWI